MGNGRNHLWVIFDVQICHYGRGGVVRQHELGNICGNGLKGGGVCALTPIEAYVEAEGGISIWVDPPVTVVLDTGDFRFAVMGWYDGDGSTFCNGIGTHQSNCNK